MVVVPGKHILQLSLPPLEPNLRMSEVWVGGGRWPKQRLSASLGQPGRGLLGPQGPLSILHHPQVFQSPDWFLADSEAPLACSQKALAQIRSECCAH